MKYLSIIRTAREVATANNNCISTINSQCAKGNINAVKSNYSWLIDTTSEVGDHTKLNTIVTAEVASKMLGVSTRQVQRLCKKKRILSRKTGKIWIISLASLIDYKKARK